VFEIKAAEVLNIQGNVVWTGYGLNKKESGTLKISKLKSSVSFEKNILTGVVVSIDMNSLTTGKKEVLDLLKGDSFFNVNRFPSAILKSTSVKVLKKISDSKTEYEVFAELTIKNKTKPIKFTSVVEKKSRACSADVDYQIEDRTQFGLKFNSKKYTPEVQLGEQLISDHIDLKISLECKK
jgi:polyisoprenoid-binding protein YceI